jgi:hypothetical protein
MDLKSMVFYALVCGVLAAFSPSIGNRNKRLIFGSVIGLLAALAMPTIRSLISF